MQNTTLDPALLEAQLAVIRTAAQEAVPGMSRYNAQAELFTHGDGTVDLYFSACAIAKSGQLFSTSLHTTLDAMKIDLRSRFQPQRLREEAARLIALANEAEGRA